MKNTYAVIETSTGHVVNIILWDGEAEWFPPEGCTIRPATEADVIWQPDQTNGK